MKKRIFLLLFIVVAAFIWMYAYKRPQLQSRADAVYSPPAPQSAAASEGTKNIPIPAAHVFGKRIKTSGCAANGLLPDPACTPGAVDSTLTADVICDKSFRTGSVRNRTTSESEKNTLYVAYGIPHPENNVGHNQVCELDHVVSIELGGADSLDNVWTECGPADVPLNERYFKMKDKVENYLRHRVCVDKDLDLPSAQLMIATDWFSVYNSMPDSWKRHR